MLISKCFVTFLVLCAGGALCKPTESYTSEPRGIGSTLWDWITYPFSWWGSSDEIPTNQPLVGNPTRGPYDNIEIAKRNVTVWCNDHTCTTMKCDKNGCTNVTCNIYDTYVNGECRVYNTLPPETPSPATQDATELPIQTVETSEAGTAAPTNTVEEHPLELEAVMSSTVQENPKAPEFKPVADGSVKIVTVATKNKV